MKNENKPLSRRENLVIQEIDNEILIYDLNNNKAFCLNETSALIWLLCDGNKSMTEISQELSNKTNSPANKDIVWLALNQLKKENLIENDVTIPIQFEGLSRRQVIKRIGLGSVVALPIVASLVAPMAIDAASACMTVLGGCTCVPGQPAGTICSGPGGNGMFLLACANPVCRCRQNPGNPLDDCIP